MGFIWKNRILLYILTATVALGACQPLKVEAPVSSGGTKESFTLASVTPAIANLAGGTELVISGSGFTTDSLVAIGDYECLTVSLVDSKTLKCTVPAMPEAAKVDLKVYVKLNGESLSVPFTVTDEPAPMILGMYSDDVDGSHKLSINGGSKLTIIVRDAPAADAIIYIGDKVCKTPVQGYLSLICTTEKALPKTLKVKIVNPDGQTAISSDDIEYSGIVTQALLRTLVWQPATCTSCHAGASPSGNLNLDTNTEISVGEKPTVRQRVNLDPGMGGFMPQGGTTKLTAEQLHAIDLWIDPNSP